jgi:hypothetical protein
MLMLIAMLDASVVAVSDDADDAIAAAADADVVDLAADAVADDAACQMPWLSPVDLAFQNCLQQCRPVPLCLKLQHHRRRAVFGNIHRQLRLAYI